MNSRKLIWALLLLGLAMLFLTGWNVYLSLGSRSDTEEHIERYIAEYRKEDLEVTNALIHSAVSTITLVSGSPGQDGAPGKAIVGPQGSAGKDGNDGKDGESIKGDKGDPGIPGREIELTRDSESLFWRYVGDDFWTEL